MIMSTEINNDLLVAIIGVLSALIVAMITFMGVWYQLKKTEVNTLKAKLRDKQEIVYDKIYSYIFDLLNDTINKTPIDKAKYSNRYMEIKKLLLFHASDRVVLQFTKLNMDTGRNDSILTLRNYFKLMVLIRKEIGYKGEKVNEKSILQILIANKEECESFCKQLGYKDSFLYSIKNKIFH